MIMALLTLVVKRATSLNIRSGSVEVKAIDTFEVFDGGGWGHLDLLVAVEVHSLGLRCVVVTDGSGVTCGCWYC